MNAMSHSNILYRISRLSKTYEMGEISVNALIDVDLEIYEGELIVMLGPSGSGKSTLLNIIGGIDRPTSGQVFYLDQDLAQATENELTLYRRNHVGFVFQFYNLLASLTAKENIEAITELVRNPLDPTQALALMGLTNRANHFPSQLSGGEQQRVAISRAIAKNPRVLLCDEPTGALDIKTGVLVLDALKKMNEEFKTTTILITHNAQIARMADRVIYLQDGKILKMETMTTKLLPVQLEW